MASEEGRGSIAEDIKSQGPQRASGKGPFIDFSEPPGVLWGILTVGILLRSEPERNIHLHVQGFDPVPVIMQCVSRHVSLEAGRKVHFHCKLSMFCCSDFLILVALWAPLMPEYQRAWVPQLSCGF